MLFRSAFLENILIYPKRVRFYIFIQDDLTDKIHPGFATLKMCPFILVEGDVLEIVGRWAYLGRTKQNYAQVQR